MTAGEPASRGLAVGVGPVTLPRYLARPQLARRLEGSVIAYEEYRRWAAPLDEELLRVLGENLRALLPSDRVVVYPHAAPFALDYRVTLDVARFETLGDQEVVLRARWTLLEGEGRETLRVGGIETRVPLRSGDPGAVAEAHSLALGTLARTLAEDLRSASATPPPPSETP